MDINKEAISLYELNKSIQLEIKSSFDSTYWVIAEINDLKVNYSGHCYIELIEKDKSTDAVIAKARGTIWARTYTKLLPYFETTTQHAFCEGIKIMVCVTVEFHELYGLSLNIIDIDPAYTIGDLLQQKQATIEKLKKEGVFFMNKELQLPLVIQNIAVISSKKAAGYGDFTNQLESNSYGYRFYTKLFPAIMQGENAEQSLIDALETVYNYEDFFDAVVIIRGGGSKTDLSCFDKYWLSYHVAQFPLPVLTGIGHEQDDTVTDMVAHTRLKTPTAVASFLIEKAADFENRLDNLFNQIKEHINDIVNDQNEKLVRLSSFFLTNVKLIMVKKNELVDKLHLALHNSTIKYFDHKQTQHRILLDNTWQDVKNDIRIKSYSINQYNKMIKTRIGFYFKNKTGYNSHLKQLISAFDPQNVLNRGYSITFKDDEVIKNLEEINVDDIIHTRLKKGIIKSKVTQIK